ncbi:MAG: SGNH/GDSL hydrolase family protein, partial [Pyramidobacter sp.]|nr:SGNH/GDSL hydrolase family protein [Pyramidobacter sp.]
RVFWSPDIDYVEAELALSGWVDWLRSQAAALDAPICDFWSIFARMTNAQRSDLYIDGLHPRPEGHRLMALTAAAALREFAAGGTHL